MNPLHLLWIIPLTFILGYIACALLCANGDADKKTERNAPYWATEQSYKNGYKAGYEDGKRDAVKKGCEYCSGEFAEYQHTLNTKLNINTFGKARTLVTECTPCPPYAKCGLRGIPARSAFIINFCPNCGKDLRGEKDA